MSDLTDVCEALRFLDDRSKRNEMLEALLRKVHIPECGYLPLCRSTEPFQRVIKITANEAKAFSTKVSLILNNLKKYYNLWDREFRRSLFLQADMI